MLLFRLLAIKLEQDFINLDLVGVLADSAVLDYHNSLAKDQLIIVFVKNAVIKANTKEAFLVFL